MLGMYHVAQAAAEATKSTVRTEPATPKAVRKEGEEKARWWAEQCA
jgi:hypothetical protein